MSKALFNTGGLRFWSEDEIMLRNMVVDRTNAKIRSVLLDMNKAWAFFRCEGPILTPMSLISDEYTENDVFITNHSANNERWALRGETTISSYTYAKHLIQTVKRAKPPFCVMQVGKSFRREKADGASPSKLRYNEFYQAEWQCIYSEGTMADYRQAVIDQTQPLMKNILGTEIRVVDSDRIPKYSDSTIDLEAKIDSGWREIASVSIRNDFGEGIKVLEFALGLDRVIEIAGENEA